ncbi:chemotaxis protein CheZ [Nitrosomonas marina]|uniref:Protein phosphatase CheZ n=1 Tax=Nitrosomonas marina TaxID=917 RepID=A0A1I0DKD1_9PROT|nr:protein phosphatase CheZ [Nitrosomonas marina]SET32285.1 chemotaxis protein CheZ [Nitrosomonas marina]
MNTSTHIREEAGMLSSNNMHDVSESAEMGRATEADSITVEDNLQPCSDDNNSSKKHSNCAPSAHTTESIISPKIDNNTGTSEHVVPETVLMQVVDEMSHSINTDPLQETVDSKTAGVTTRSNEEDRNILDQVGCLTRNLHNSLRELGYDKRIESLVSEVPEAQDKLAYVATKTEQAAERVLNATETTMPIQEKLSLEATQLSEKWKLAFEEQRLQPNTEKFKQLLIETLSFIDRVPEQTDATNAQLMEIMMAQDFQDLTGQVIKKITHMVQRLEHDLVQLLLANVPPANKQKVINEGLLNGPVTNPEKSSEAVTNQDQVDDLLASLGF